MRRQIALAFIAFCVGAALCVPTSRSSVGQAATASPTLAISPPISLSNVKNLHVAANLSGIAPGDYIGAVTFNRSGSLFAALSETGTVYIWNSRTYERVAVLRPEPENPSSSGLAFSPDDSLLASGNFDHLLLWNVEDVLNQPEPTPKIFYKSPEGPLSSIAFSPDGTLIAAGDDVGYVRVWDLHSGLLKFTLQDNDYNQPVGRMEFSPNGSLLASTSNIGKVHLWRVIDGEIEAVLDDYGPISFSPTNDRIAVVVISADPNDLHSPVELYDLKKIHLVKTLKSPDGLLAIGAMTFSPDGKMLVAGSGFDGGLTFWDVNTGKVIAQKDDGAVSMLRFSPDNTRLGVGHFLGYDQVQLWSVK